MLWKSLSFSELTLDELYELLKVRVDVFVVEQNCPYPELDNKDRHQQTQHLLGVDEQGVIQAYARVLAPGISYPDASIGRVIVSKEARGGGVAHTLMQKAIAISLKRWPDNNIQLGGQEHLKGFYQQLGFEPVSEMYLEDGIPHLDMLLTLEH